MFDPRRRPPRPVPRWAALAAVPIAAVVAFVAWLLAVRDPRPTPERGPTTQAVREPGARTPARAPTPRSPAQAPEAPEPPPVDPGPPSDQARLRLHEVITGDIAPKSLEATPTGLVFAQNMMYRHTVTVYDPRLDLVKTIRDAVRLSEFGFPRGTGSVRGAPVEAASTADGAQVYVSNYSMYGPGFSWPGSDVCSPSEGRDESFVYRVDTRRLRIGDVIGVGSTPKYVELTPDGRLLLVANWCSYDLSVVRTSTGHEIERIPLGPYPRGIAVDPRGRRAYVAVMGSSDIAVVNLRTFDVRWFRGVGAGPRHLVVDDRGRYLYATISGEGGVAKIALPHGRVVDRVATGSQPRSMAIAPDGRSLYVVNYESHTVSKIRTRRMEVLQTVRTNVHPIGITYEPIRRSVWVSCYSGSIMVFRDR